jgi:hypothetical protein
MDSGQDRFDEENCAATTRVEPSPRFPAFALLAEH